MAFLAVLNIFLVQKLIFGHFWDCKKWKFGQTFFREIDLYDFMSFFSLDFFKFSGPLCTVCCYYNFTKKMWKTFFDLIFFSNRICPTAGNVRCYKTSFAVKWFHYQENKSLRRWFIGYWKEIKFWKKSLLHIRRSP